MDIRDKVKKLLSLATSPNENEAKAALLKAKKLMMEHKISEAEVQGVDEQELTHLQCEEISWTTDSGEIWMVDLTNLIADNHLCACSWSTYRGRRTHMLEITGLKQDAELCREVIKYAVGFVRSRIKIEQRRRSSSDPKAVARSYAKGFVLGMSLMYDEQKDEHPEWGLVVSKPQEVDEYMKSLGTKKVQTRQVEFDQLAYMRGQNDGMAFSPNKVLEEGERHEYQ